MSKKAKIHFLTAYVEYLLDQGIRSEEYYLGDASRFLRFLLANTTYEQIESYINNTNRSPSYRARLETSLRKFFVFAEEKLAIKNKSLQVIQKETRSAPGLQSNSGRGDTI
ncbi:MAG: hypothetical protein QM401_07720 [Bacillota bacterium]|nr:hypothetical protein [Bacillota bacterium]HHU62339.1 hypothetical protein [Natronincola sp.]